MKTRVRIHVGLSRPIATLTILFLSQFAIITSAQDESESSQAAATTVADPEIDVDHLKVKLRPLTQDELRVELDAWLKLLRQKIRTAGDTELDLLDLAEDEPADDLRSQIVELKSQEKGLVERSRTVLEALKAKGGEVQSEEMYIAAISDISQTADTTSYWAAVRAEIEIWVWKDDGGRLWLRRFLMAMGVLFVFWVASRFAGRITAKALSRHHAVSNLLENFARRTAGGVVFVVGILMALAVMGMQIGPLMAALGAGGFIIGFALQDTLGNFASGLMIMVYRPFDVDDYISVAGSNGTVKQMSLVSTTLLTVDNKVLIIPNKKAWSDTITNYTGRDTRRIDLVFGISYDDNIQQAIDVLTEIASNHEQVLNEPAINVNISELGDSSVNLFCRPWVKTSDYWAVRADIIHAVKERFDAEGISFPYPQQDVHLDPVPVSKA